LGLHHPDPDHELVNLTPSTQNPTNQLDLDYFSRETINSAPRTANVISFNIRKYGKSDLLLRPVIAAIMKTQSLCIIEEI
jgi:hypothetical protein